MSSHLVAVVDDDASVRRGLTRLLQSADLRVLTYASATEFLDMGLSIAPDCVILDIHLGGMSGLELLSRLRTVASRAQASADASDAEAVGRQREIEAALVEIEQAMGVAPVGHA